MTDPRDIAEFAVLAVPFDDLQRLIDEYLKERGSANRLAWLRSQLAIAARRAIDGKPEVEQ